MGINLGWNAGINDTMVIKSIVMTTCISPFSKAFLDFDSTQKISTLKHVFLKMLLMHFYIKQFHLQSDYGQNCHVQQSQCKYA
jgi:hypothetical protein